MYIVSNSGTHPEPAYIAAGLAKAGSDVVYATSTSYAQDSRLLRLANASLLRNSKISRQVRRRALPEGLVAVKTHHTAQALELAFQLSLAAKISQESAILTRRTAKHRTATARLVKRTRNIEAVIGQYHSALEPFLAAKDSTKRILMYPIAHHHWMQERMSQEAAENPDWAKFLQGYDPGQAKLDLMDREIQLADEIIVVSSFVKSTFLSMGISEEKIHVLPLGADFNENENTGLPDIVNLPGQDPEVFRFVIAGQITQRKGISYVLDAFQSLDRPNAELLIIGRATPEMETRIRPFRNVRRLPPMPRAELAEYFRSADVLLLPSLAEGFPLVAIEAMSHGTPAILSHYTSAPDLISEGVNGLTVDAASTNQLVTAMRRLFDDRTLLSAMSSSARVTARQYTWQRYEDSAVNLIQNLTCT